MTEAIIDSDILSYFFKGEASVVANFEQYSKEFKLLGISQITYYEILSGLLAKGASRQINVFREFVKESKVYSLTEESIQISADIYAQLRRAGTPLDDLDLLIAGIAIDNKLTLVTNNVKHFSRIKQLKIENWKS
jgi:tRNA(fMet)-specific endonuclease VapC